MSIEEQYEKLYRDCFERWLTAGVIGCNCWDHVDGHCNIDRGKEMPQNASKVKRYDVFIDDIAKHIYGDAGYVTEDAILTIFKDDEQVAVFREWDYYLVKEVPNDD